MIDYQKAKAGSEMTLLFLFVSFGNHQLSDHIPIAEWSVKIAGRFSLTVSGNSNTCQDRLLPNRLCSVPCVIHEYCIFHKCLSETHYPLSHKCFISFSYFPQPQHYKEIQLWSGYVSCHGPEYLF